MHKSDQLKVIVLDSGIDIEEIEKEKKNRQALHSFFPHSMGSEDNTRYVLLGNNKPEPKVNNPFEQPKQESSNVKSGDDFVNDEKVVSNTVKRYADILGIKAGEEYKGI